ncbi:MAG: hypothetical protein K6G42_10870 [Lachnospiraceae bacterium]|nr:hypothetical protein [Lachnospiraceae bacterium]
MRNKKNDTLIIFIFMIIISISLVLGCLKHFTSIPFDVELKGYIDVTDDIELSADSILDRSFMNYFESKIDTYLPLRGIYIKTYNTLMYYLFNVGNRPIGKDGYIFEPAYLESTCCMGVHDYSSETKNKEMQDFVDQLVEVNNKLNAIGKSFFVYVVPGKSTILPEKMPLKYRLMYKEKSLNSTESLKEMIQKANLPCVFCEDYVDSLEYPPFYSSGIHWSRTYEQFTSKSLVNEIGELTKKHYKNFSTDSVAISTEPFRRDADVYNLLNLWPQPECTYYQYNTSAPVGGGYDRLNMLLYGDSFSEGLYNDLYENIPEDNIARINRDEYVANSTGSFYDLNHDWTNLNLQFHLDCADVIAVEIVEPCIVDYTNGYLKYLSDYLDTYVPKPINSYYLDCFDANDPAPLTDYCGKGFYGKEQGFSWVKPYASLTINEKSVSAAGIEISYTVPQQIFDFAKEDIVDIYINSKLYCQKKYEAQTTETLVISREMLGEPVNGGYNIEIRASEYFNPAEKKMSDDGRDLAIQCLYLGGVR